MIGNSVLSYLIVEKPQRRGLYITLHRPEALNALNTALLAELAETLTAAEDNTDVRAVVIAGSIRAFAAGTDINEMADRDLVGLLNDPRLRH